MHDKNLSRIRRKPEGISSWTGLLLIVLGLLTPFMILILPPFIDLSGGSLLSVFAGSVIFASLTLNVYENILMVGMLILTGVLIIISNFLLELEYIDEERSHWLNFSAGVILVIPSMYFIYIGGQSTGVTLTQYFSIITNDVNTSFLCFPSLFILLIVGITIFKITLKILDKESKSMIFEKFYLKSRGRE